MPGAWQANSSGDDSGKKTGLPIGSGLGSSACSVVAALMAMNEHCGKPLNDTRLLALMGELERISGSIHYDNVAPCFLGGMQLIMRKTTSSASKCQGLISGCGCWRIRDKFSTAEARAILPAQYRRQDCIAHGRHLADFRSASAPVSQPVRLMKVYR